MGRRGRAVLDALLSMTGVSVRFGGGNAEAGREDLTLVVTYLELAG